MSGHWKNTKLDAEQMSRGKNDQDKHNHFLLITEAVTWQHSHMRATMRDISLAKIDSCFHLIEY